MPVYEYRCMACGKEFSIGSLPSLAGSSPRLHYLTLCRLVIANICLIDNTFI